MKTKFFSFENREEPLDHAIGYYMRFFGAALIVCIGFFSTVILIYNTQLSGAIAFFSYFENSQQLLSPLIPQIPTFIGLPAFFAYILGFFSFFNYIRRKGAKVYDAEGNIETKYFDVLLSFFGMFNYLILIPLILYLVAIEQHFSEFIVLVGLLVLTKLLFIPLLSNAVKVVQNYKALSICNPYYGNEDIKEGLFRDAMILLRSFYGYTISQKDAILKGIMSLTLLVPLLAIGFNFNALSVVYIGLTFVIWYFIVSVVSLLPFKKVNIYLNDGQILKSVYIIEDSQKGHLIVLTPEKQMPIMKDTIIKTEMSEY